MKQNSFRHIGGNVALIIVVSILALTSLAWTALADTVIDAGPAPGPITLSSPTVIVPVRITRSDTTATVMAFHVKFTVSSNLTLPAGKSSITLGGFLNANGGRTVTFLTTDLGGGVYQADGSILGHPCGSSAFSGILCRVAVTSSATGGTGTITIDEATLRSCSNVTIPETIGTVAYVTIDRSAPAVAVTAPNGGETWHSGSPQSITWTASDPEGINTFDLAYSTDGGVTYPNVIATGVSGALRSYAWTVPDVPTTTARVRIVARDVNGNQNNDASDANFTIARYVITATSGGNGTITPSGAIQEVYGATQPFAIAPALHYHILDVLVDGLSVGPVTGYTFSNITADHTIAASFTLDLVTNLNTTLTYATIQAALDAVETLDTHVIQVAAGTFEEQVVITKNVAITGAGCGSTIIRSPVTLTQSFTTSEINKPIVFFNGTSTALLQNLTVDGYGRGNTNYRFVGIGFWNGGGKVAQVCVVHVRETPWSGNQHGVGVYAYNNISGTYAIELDQVAVTDFQKTGIALCGQGLTVNVHDCITTGNGYTDITAQNGIEVADGAGGQVRDCKISDIGYSPATWTASGLLAYECGSPLTVSGLKGANLIDNVQSPVSWYNSSGSLDGIEVSSATGSDWGPIFIFNQNTSLKGQVPQVKRPPLSLLNEAYTPHNKSILFTVNVTNCCLTGRNLTNTVGIGAYTYGGGMNVTATNNVIHNWDYGLTTYGSTAVLTANLNSVTGNTSAGYDDTAGVAQNAENNWWGAAGGPGTGGANPVVGAVDYDPWLGAGTNIESGCGFTPKVWVITATKGPNGGIDPIGAVNVYEGNTQVFTIAPDPHYHVANVLVDGHSVGAVTSYTFSNVIADHTIDASFTADLVTNTDTGLTYATIQAALDAPETLDTHTIQVAAGVFVEQVVITKNVTITGAGCGSTIIRSPAILTQSFTTSTANKPIVFVNGKSNVTIQNLTVDGDGQGNLNYRFIGIAYWNGGGKVSQVCIEHVRETPLSGNQHGVGLYSYNNTSGSYALEVDRAVITDFQKNAMALSGNGMVVNVHDCTTTGSGYFETTAQNGIQVGYGAGGQVRDCTISNMGWTGPGDTASGLLAYYCGSPLTVSGLNGAHVITGVQTPVAWYETNGSISGIEVSGGADFRGAIDIWSEESSDKAGGTKVPFAPLAEEGFLMPAKSAGFAVDVNHCCLTGTHVPGMAAIGAYTAGGTLTVTASNNVIHDWAVGLTTHASPAILTANLNSIVGNTTAGYDNTGSVAQNAENNWWGAAAGPTDPGASHVLGDVDYDPWLGSGTNIASGCGFAPKVWVITASAGPNGNIVPSGAVNVYQGNDQDFAINPTTGYHVLDVLVDGISVGAVTGYTFHNVTADHTIAASFTLDLVTNLNTHLTYATIQAALNAPQTLDTHTIQVAAGIFVEQVVIAKDVTITGAGCGSTIIKSPAILTQSFATPGVKKPVVFVNGKANVTIQNLTVDGDGQGAANNAFIGIAYWNGGGKVSHVCIEHVRDNPLSGAQHGVGLYSYNNTGGPYVLEADHVTITDFQKNAMALSGNGMLVNVHDCTATGAGYFTTTAQNGIQVSYGAGGTVTACKISNIGYSGPGWSASGMLAWACGSNLNVSNLKGAFLISNVQAPVSWYDTNGSLDGIEVSVTTGSDWGPIYIQNSSATLKGQAEQPKHAPLSPLTESYTAGDKASLFTVSVTNCCLTGHNLAGTAGIGAYTEGGGLNVTATNNVVHNWDVGLTTYGTQAILTANLNSVTGNTTAGYDNGASLVAENAENNWWGAAAGPTDPGANPVLGATVDFTPWLGSGTNIESGCGFAPKVWVITATADPNGSIVPGGAVNVYEGNDQGFAVNPHTGYHVLDVKVDGISVGAVTGYTFHNVTADHTIAATFTPDLVTNLNTGLTYATIQAALDAPQTEDHHTIQVAAGTFEEQVVIAKDVTITGAGCGSTTIMSPPILTQSFNPGSGAKKPVVFVNGKSDVTIQNLTVDGAGRGDANYSFIGIGYWNGGGKVSHVCIERVRDNTFSGAQHGVGLYSYNNTGGPYTLEVEYVTVTDFQKNAMALSGNGMVVNVHDCTVTGHGYTGVTAQNGIQVGFGAGGQVRDCAISDIGYTGPSWSASGLLAYACGSSLTVSSLNGAHVITNCQDPVSWYDTNGSMTGIEVSGGADWGPIFIYNSQSTDKDHVSGLKHPSLSPLDETGYIQPAKSAGFTVSVSNCCLTGTNAAGTAGIGAFTEGGTLTVTATNNVLHKWDVGLTTYGTPAILTANLNSVTGNTTAGYDNGASVVAQNAENNWWGAADGPAYGGHGSGDAIIGATVGFTPWLGSGTNIESGCGFAPKVWVITASAGSNGHIAPNGAVNVYEGNSQGFTITADPGYHVLDVLIDGGSVGPLTGYTFSNVIANHTIAASFLINPPVSAITNLAAVQVLTGNPAGSTTQIQLTWTAPPGTTVKVYRCGFGHYPEYDNAGGVVPTPTPTYPPSSEWLPTGVAVSGDKDLFGTRDFYYYIAYVKDIYGTWSPVSNMTGGTLNYHLGDVSDGHTEGTGNDRVYTEDISLLGYHYGLVGGAVAPYSYLDVGPTTTEFTDGRPVTDQVIGFEDLVMFALNYDLVSKTNPKPAAASQDELALQAPGTVNAGDVFEASVLLSGTGLVQGLSVALAWDPLVVTPVAVTSGQLATDNGAVVFSPKPGVADAAVLGTVDGGFTGSGEVAGIRFRALAGGSPAITIATVIGRDGHNHPVTLAYTTPSDIQSHFLPKTTELLPATPNPFGVETSLRYRLASPGEVHLAIFSADGRRVRVLSDGPKAAGEYVVRWNGTDDRGQKLGVGQYFLRLQTGRFSKVRHLTIVR